MGTAAAGVAESRAFIEQAKAFHGDEPLPEWLTVPLGLPRPRTATGLPVPYIASSPDELGVTSPSRTLLSVLDGRCQVCGRRCEGDTVLLGRRRDRYVIDRCPLHPACWLLARRHCPFLRSMSAERRLYEWVVDSTELRHDGYGVLVPHPARGRRVVVRHL